MLTWKNLYSQSFTRERERERGIYFRVSMWRWFIILKTEEMQTIKQIVQYFIQQNDDYDNCLKTKDFH